MKKKLILGGVALFVVAGGVAGMSAFEAHVINVTAKIEGALSVPSESIYFGTVFPQEELDRDIHITLSTLFVEDDGVDDWLVKRKAYRKMRFFYL